MPIIIILVVIFIIALLYHMALGLLAWLNFGTGFYVLSALCLALIIYNIISGKKALKNNESNESNIAACTIFTIGLVIFLACGIATPYAVNWQKEADVKNEARRGEEAERKRVEAEKEREIEQGKKERAEADAKLAAVREQNKKADEQRAQYAKEHPEEAIRSWCSRMRIIITDIDEQWEHWWPIATRSHDVVTEYDAANTLNLNLKQYLKSLDGNNYKIPENVSPAQKSQMNEIYKKLHDSLWKRIRASEKYAKGLKSGNFDLSEAEGIRRRATEADITAAEASSLLKTLEGQMGM